MSFYPRPKNIPESADLHKNVGAQPFRQISQSWLHHSTFAYKCPQGISNTNSGRSEKKCRENQQKSQSLAFSGHFFANSAEIDDLRLLLISLVIAGSGGGETVACSPSQAAVLGLIPQRSYTCREQMHAQRARCMQTCKTHARKGGQRFESMLVGTFPLLLQVSICSQTPQVQHFEDLPVLKKSIMS